MAAEEINTEIGKVIDRFEEAADAEDWSGLDLQLAALRPEDMRVAVTLAWLSMTLVAKDRLPARAGLLEKTRGLLRQERGELQADLLLRGLDG
jgi:hypothetical protein